MKIAEWESILFNEQETHINIDYHDRAMKLYTNRQAVARKLKNRLGEPTETFHMPNGNISGVSYKLDLHDKRVNQLLSKTIVVGGFSTPKSE